MKNAYLAALIASVLLVPGTALAELVHGQIAQIDQQNNQITLNPQEPRGQLPQELQVNVEQQALQDNPRVQSLDQLSVGDEVIVEAEQQAFGDAWDLQDIITAQQVQQGQQEGGLFGGEEGGGQQAGQQQAGEQEGGGMFGGEEEGQQAGQQQPGQM